MANSIIKTLAFGGIAAAGLAVATAAYAASSRPFDFTWVGVNATSSEKCFEGICTNLVINRVRVNGDKNEVCALFYNDASTRWSGGFRLTSFNDPTTHRTISVPAGSEGRYCEIVPNTTRYWVVLRQD